MMYLKELTTVLILGAALANGAAVSLAADVTRARELFDFDWKFSSGEVEGAEKVTFDSSKWQAVDLPHDFSIIGPFDKDAPLGTRYGFRPLGIGWYRKTFPTPAATEGRHFSLEFEGVCREAKVWVNGVAVATNCTWSAPWRGFICDITAYLKPAGGTNIVAVRADAAKEPGVTWYNGGGIYRHVWLVATKSLHVARHGTFVTTPQVSLQEALINIRTEIENDSSDEKAVTLRSEVQDAGGKVVATVESTLPARKGETAVCQQEVKLKNPALWDLKNPTMYKLLSSVSAGGQETDVFETPFGIREIRLTPDGLFLNGKREFIKGINIHHDLGCLGVAAFDRGIERRLRLIKELGLNGLRLSHNPHAPALLDLCDRLGILVFDEAFCNWGDTKRFKFAECWRDDLEDFVRRDRNHPSVFIWSVGNQVSAGERAPDYGCDQFDAMRAVVRALDTTRKVTTTLRPIRRSGASAEFKPENKADVHQLGLRADVMSANYMEQWLARDRQIYTNLVFILSECNIREGGRGAWYDLDRDHAVGLFYWGGIDYIGESGGWPVKCWKGGFIDWAGFRKPSSWVIQALASEQPMVHLAIKTPDRSYVNWDGVKISLSGLLNHWNFAAGKKVDVECISNVDEVDLLLNGRSLGTKKRESEGKSAPRLLWSVPWEPGTLTAVARKGGAAVARDELKSAGAPKRLRLSPDRPVLLADGQDLSHITVEVVDEQGVLVPDDKRMIRFEVTGPGSNAGVQNSDVISDELFQADQRSAFEGRALLVVRSKRQPGEIVVKASADGVEAAILKLQSK